MYRLVLVFSVIALLSLVGAAESVQKRSPIDDSIMASLVGSGV
uniref:Venom peptide n=1 Tax=Comana monomorpha TaxID=1555636 RepID=A0AAU6PBG0_9NEOP